MRDKIPFWTHKVRGDDVPSSLTFVEDGIVIGRKNGTIFQLLSPNTKTVLSTLKFVNNSRDDPEMFGHINYDARIQTLWIANSRRESILGVRLGYQNTGNDLAKVGFIDQMIEFIGPKPTIHFVILTGDSDPNGEEAHAACVAAKIVPGDLSLVSFSVHQGGVDQVLIRREWLEEALPSTLNKLPSASPVPESKITRALPSAPAHLAVPPLARTPPSEEIEGDTARDDSRQSDNNKGRGMKAKNVGWKDKDDNGKGKDKNIKVDEPLISDSAISQIFSREMRKSEESLHTRIGRLIGKEMDKQRKSFCYPIAYIMETERVLYRPTTGRRKGARPSRRFFSPGEDFEAYFHRAHEEHHARG